MTQLPELHTYINNATCIGLTLLPGSVGEHRRFMSGMRRAMSRHQIAMGSTGSVCVLIPTTLQTVQRTRHYALDWLAQRPELVAATICSPVPPAAVLNLTPSKEDMKHWMDVAKDFGAADLAECVALIRQATQGALLHALATQINHSYDQEAARLWAEVFKRKVGQHLATVTREF